MELGSSIQEPWRLRISLDEVIEELKTVSIKNYSVFLRNQECSDSVAHQLSEMGQRIEAIDQSWIKVKDGCDAFSTETQDIVQSYQRNQFTLEHYPELMGYLELPHLFDGCIRGKLYDEALNLLEFSNEVGQAFEQHQLHLIHHIKDEMEQSSQVLRMSLLKKLKSKLSLSQCFKVISALKRLDKITGMQQKIKGDYKEYLKSEFLSCRDTWLASMIRQESRLDPYQKILKMIEIQRNSWFDLMNQYDALFRDHNNAPNESQDPNKRQQFPDALLCSWALQNTRTFVRLLQSNVHHIRDCAHLSECMDQSSHFAQSLGRVGLDFRSSLVMVFQSHLLALMSHQWHAAIAAFQHNLLLHSESKSSATPVMISVTTTNVGQKLAEDVMMPPREILSFPMLVEVLNVFLTSFNDLRRCALNSCERPLAQMLLSASVLIVQHVMEFCDTNDITHLVSKTKESARRRTKIPLEQQIHALSKVLVQHFFPFLLSAFQAIYPHSTSTGVDLHEQLQQHQVYRGMVTNFGLDAVHPTTCESKEEAKQSSIPKEINHENTLGP